MKSLLFLLVLLAFAVFVFAMAFAGCESNNYTEAEKRIIEQLRNGMHDPKSLEVISITSVELMEYEHFEKIKANIKLYFLAKLPKEWGDPFKLYTIRYRGANAFGALRLNSIIAIAGKDRSVGSFCHFYKEDALLDKKNK